MPVHVDITEFLEDIAVFLGCFYASLAVANGLAAGWAWSQRRVPGDRRGRRRAASTAAAWLVLTALYAIMAAVAFTGDAQWMSGISMPEAVKDALDRALTPTSYTLGLIASLALLFWARRFCIQPAVAWLLMNLGLMFIGWSLTDPDFARLVGKPDNVPIVGMIFLLGFCTWVATRRAVLNDARLARGEPPLEAMDQDKVLVWPDLVYIELICMVAVTALLIVWSIGLKAPLEEAANAAVTPNPSKAPWYFLGLQELLVYFDPWLAGVVLPALAIFGLCSIPYLDGNPEGDGFYAIGPRRFAYLVFQSGFLVLWISPIVVGTFFRGSNWDFFGLHETWDPHQQPMVRNVNLSGYFWVWLLGGVLPAAPQDAGAGMQVLGALYRELPGLVLMGLYFLAVPWALACRSVFFRRLAGQLGRFRFGLMMFLLLLMVLVPIKMLVYWNLNLRYLIAFPEWSFNL